MKIGFLGGTSLSNTLGKKYLEAGLEVVFGVSSDFDTEAPEWKLLNRLNHRICPYESAIIQSEIILICAETTSLAEIIKVLNTTETDDKIIIDCTNSDISQLPNSVLIRSAAPKALHFRAFNNFGVDYPKMGIFRRLEETKVYGEAIPQKLRVRRLVELIGYKAIDADQITIEPEIFGSKPTKTRILHPNYPMQSASM